MDKNNGGPAFPRFVPDGHYNGSIDEQGMTLRDYFAAKAAEAYLMPAGQGQTWASRSDFDYIAESAYQMADAMLRAREQ